MSRAIAVVALLFVLVSSTTTSHHQSNHQSLHSGISDQAAVQSRTVRPDPHLVVAKNYTCLVTATATTQVMSYPHMRPQKRKMHDFISGPRISKEPKRFFTASSYQPPTLFQNYFAGALPPLAPYSNYDARTRHPSKLRFSHFSSSTFKNTPITTPRNTHVANAWYEEWQTKPRVFGPVIPLKLLTQPAEINLTTHSHDAKRIYLNHWDCDHEPDGAAAQRLALQRRREERQQKERRKKVIQAARAAFVVDLTRDETMEDMDAWGHP